LEVGRVNRALEAFLARAAGAKRASVVEFRPLAGGAIQDNRLLTVDVEGGAHAGRLEAVLRIDAPSRVPISHGRAHEFAILKAAFAAGVTVPEPLWLCEDTDVLGGPFFVMRRASGVAAGHRVVKDVASPGAGEALVARLAAEMAKIHAIAPPRADLGFLPLPAVSPALRSVARFRDFLDRHRAPRPVLEWGLRWLERHAPPKGEIVLCHHDFRTGNYLVHQGRLAGVLDWEFAGWSDPHEDIGWFMAKCWRFGRVENEAGGIGARETFHRAYEKASGRRVDRAQVAYWEVMAHARWAAIALQQAERHVSGVEPSLELALTAHVVPELELEILRATRES
jgi:aminoglycoside phosphotransferase (APT) family kinase protein